MALASHNINLSLFLPKELASCVRIVEVLYRVLFEQSDLPFLSLIGHMD
jgi:hypothetical protein